MTNTTREAEEYLDAVRAELADLPEEERGELLEDLAQHLTDIAADESRADVPLKDLLGAPADYASELRTAAGLPSKDSRRRMKVPRPDVSAWLNNSSLGQWVNGPAGQRLLGPSLSLFRELRPAWWVLRGVLLVAVFSWPATGHPIPEVFGSRMFGLLLIGGVVALSVKVGRLGYGGWKRLVVVVDVFVVLLALTVPGPPTTSQVLWLDRPSNWDIVATHLGPVTNIYPYDAQGRPLDNVLLFDQEGRPFRVARQEQWPDGCDRVPTYPHTADGRPIEFSYPVNYTLDLEPFASLPEEHRALLEKRMADQCQQIPRPLVPLPTFPPEVTTEVEPATEPEAPPEDAPQTAP
ncbi:MAG: hypothetical protein KY395_01005 [Actinobacteria bacterium]|nr:hypothetical protein [Actinomycetota bacterium]